MKAREGGMEWKGIVKLGSTARVKPARRASGPAPIVLLSHQVSTSLAMPVCLRGALLTMEEGEAKAARLTVKGELVIGGLGVELIFGSPEVRPSKLKPPHDVATKAVLLPAGEAFEVNDRSKRAKVAADTAAWIQVRDEDGVPLTDHIYLGRLGRGPCLMDPAFTSLVSAETYVSPGGLPVAREFDLLLTGEMTFVGGIWLRITLRRREGALWWGRRPDAALDLEIVPAGHRIHFPAQPVWSNESVGGLKSLIFLDGEGDPIGQEHPVKPMVALQ